MLLIYKPNVIGNNRQKNIDISDIFLKKQSRWDLVLDTV